MRWVVDLCYLVFLVFASPVLLPGMIRRGRHRTDWSARFGRVPATARRHRKAPRVLIHAVSVGEVNAIRGLIPRLHASGIDVVIAVTTDTGFQRASTLFGSHHEVVRYPLDLSWCVGRFLRAVSPDAVALVELEVWPNFVSACRRRGAPVQIVNGRLSDRSMRRYRRFRWFISPMFRKIDRVGAQDAAIADRFRALGVPPDRIAIDGNMKWDNAQLRAGVDGSDEFLRSMGIDPERPLIVAGSTAPEEHA
ncbi:MAG: glycosyltransferase N-terminal domain-containing protein, partial [Phycisphaerales bacterium]|nr:glycosyltransferase N-terminal domain-containing protein [Phycisphaerales bacterium]